MPKLRKNDVVQIIKGEDRGKRGRIISVLSGGRGVIVEGLNFVKKHKRQTRQDEKGGILQIESPVALGNVMFVCKACGRPARLGFSVMKDGSKSRVCKSCKEAV